MYSYVRCDEIEVNPSCKSKLISLYNLYMQHQFDLLGSGYVKVNYKLQAKGVHGKRYIDPHMAKYEKVAYKKLHYNGKCSSGYEPINWFVDYKSGFFFNPLKYNSLDKCQAVIGKIDGVDIKCPWELGRFYHVVQLAVLAAVDEKYRENIIVEFKNEIIDFITMNPVGKTVQWSAPMDAAIRMVNLLIAYDLLSQLDNDKYLDNIFKKEFELFIRDSLKYIMERLERGGNHYLSNLVGVIFGAAFLPSDDWTDACLVFGVQELISQVRLQFYEEGAHFEGSTSYHRLSAEFVIYATAMIYGVLESERASVFTEYNAVVIDKLVKYNRQKYDENSGNFFPQGYIDRLYNMGIFTKSILKRNNEIVQIGDNDSGRLVKLTPMGDNNADNVLDQRTLLAQIGGLFIDTAFQDAINAATLEFSLIQALAKGRKISGNLFSTQIEQYGQYKENILPYRKETILYEQSEGKSLTQGMKIYYYKQFGIVVLRGERLFLSMVVGTTKEKIYVGHTHNDQLSIEVMVDDKYVTRDPGGYIYTAAPKIRDCFRSVRAHNTIHVKGYEQNTFAGTFGIKRNVKSELLYCAGNKIVGRARYADVEHIREIEIDDNKIIVRDFANLLFTVGFKNKVYSTGYGKLERNREGIVEAI